MNKICSQVRRLFSSYINDDLDYEHSFIVRNHFKKCFLCRAKIKWLSFQKTILKITLVIAVIGAAMFLIVRSTNKVEIPFEIGTKKVVSNIIIEIASRDSEGDTNLVKNFTNNFGAKIVDENPLSIRLVKQKVNEFIKELDKILVLPEDTFERVDEFIKPLGEKDEVVVKIKFLS